MVIPLFITADFQMGRGRMQRVVGDCLWAIKISLKGKMKKGVR